MHSYVAIAMTVCVRIRADVLSGTGMERQTEAYLATNATCAITMKFS